MSLHSYRGAGDVTDRGERWSGGQVGGTVVRVPLVDLG
jgi:hypothetical protein